MKKKDFFSIDEFIKVSNIDPVFLDILSESDIIHIIDDNHILYLDAEELNTIEICARWYYDLDVNIEGIESLHYLLKRFNEQRDELNRLKEELSFYQSINHLFLQDDSEQISLLEE